MEAIYWSLILGVQMVDVTPSSQFYLYLLWRWPISEQTPQYTCAHTHTTVNFTSLFCEPLKMAHCVYLLHETDKYQSRLALRLLQSQLPSLDFPAPVLGPAPCQRDCHSHSQSLVSLPAASKAALVAQQLPTQGSPGVSACTQELTDVTCCQCFCSVAPW